MNSLLEQDKKLRQWWAEKGGTGPADEKPVPAPRSADFELHQGTVEQSLLSAALDGVDRWRQVEAEFQTDDFIAARTAYLWAGDYFEQYGVLPTNSLISRRFGEGWNPLPGAYDYWLAEMRRYTRARHLLEAVKAVYDLAGDPERAIDLLVQKVNCFPPALEQGLGRKESSASTPPPRSPRWKTSRAGG